MMFDDATEHASLELGAPQLPVSHAVSEADGAALLDTIIQQRGLGARGLALALGELGAEDRDAAMRALHAQYGNRLVDEVQTQIGEAQGPSALNVKEHIYQARLGMDGRQESVRDDAHEVSNQDIVLEQLAHAGAYDELDNRKLADWGYHMAGAISDAESGFHAILYMPADGGDARQAATARAVHGGTTPPVLAFRGTDSMRDVSDDMNRKGVGTYQFSSNASRIAELLATAGGKVVATGHSLGGALAQRTAVRFASQVSRVVTFQAPAIGADEVAALDEHNKKAEPADRVTSTHHRAEGDLIHLAGERLTSGDVFTYESVGVGNAADHSQMPLARLAAARGNMIPGVDGDDRLVRVEKTSAAEEKQGWFPAFAEKARKALGGIFRDDDMEPYVEMWRDVEQMVASGAFSQAYVLGVIEDSNRLTAKQKIKMRDEVLAATGG